MQEMLRDVCARADLPFGEVERRAAQVLGELPAGGDARDIAFAMGLEACPHSGMTRIAMGVLFFNERDHYRERNHRICMAIARFALAAEGLATVPNIAALARALNRRGSGQGKRVTA